MMILYLIGVSWAVGYFVPNFAVVVWWFGGGGIERE